MKKHDMTPNWKFTNFAGCTYLKFLPAWNKFSFPPKDITNNLKINSICFLFLSFGPLEQLNEKNIFKSLFTLHTFSAFSIFTLYFLEQALWISIIIIPCLSISLITSAYDESIMTKAKGKDWLCSVSWPVRSVFINNIIFIF